MSSTSWDGTAPTGHGVFAHYHTDDLLVDVHGQAQTHGIQEHIDAMRAFVETRIKPYYLHHPDLAPGTAHLRTGLAEGQALMRSLRARLSGLCQPAYMLDIPGGAGKVPVGPSYLTRSRTDGASCRYRVDDLEGRPHLYPPAEG